MKSIDEYLNFLWQQFQYDWFWMSNPWMLYTVIPVVLYFFFFLCKWTVLLGPITVPIMVYRWPTPSKETNKIKENNYINN